SSARRAAFVLENLEGIPRARRERRSGVDDDLVRRSAEEHLQRVQDVTPQEPLIPEEVGLQLTRMFLAVQLNPDEEAQRGRRTTADPTDQLRPAQAGVELELLAIRPREGAGVSPVSGITRSS